MSQNISCIACGNREVKRHAADFETRGTTLFECAACASLTLWPVPEKDYSTHTADIEGFRDYVEMNCSIGDIAAAVLPAVRAAGAGRFLDVGCGFGFSLDIVRELAGCEVAGVEPAVYGARGRELLGLPILPRTLSGGLEDQDETVLRRPFDVVFSSEVVEHVTDPDAFIALLKRFLTPGGILALTTPRAGALSEAYPGNEKLAVLSPGAHVFLYSQAALEAALRRAGFDHVEIHRRNVTFIAYASTRAFTSAEFDAGDETRRYLERALARGAVQEPVRTGLYNRLFRNLVERGQWEAAAALESEIAFTAAPDTLRCDNYRAFLATYRACEPSLCYHRGMLLLNHHGRYEEARDWFVSAYRFCREKLRIAPGASVVEANLVWRALFHAALSARYAGLEEAVAELWSQSASRADYLPNIPEDIEDRVVRDLGLP